MSIAYLWVNIIQKNTILAFLKITREVVQIKSSVDATFFTQVNDQTIRGSAAGR